MAFIPTFDENGLALSSRGGSKYYKVARNSAFPGFYVAADLPRDGDGKVVVHSFKPYRFLMPEQDAAFIATDLYKNPHEFVEGKEYPSFTKPDEIFYRLTGERFIYAFDKKSGIQITDEDITYRGGPERRRRNGNGETATGRHRALRATAAKVNHTAYTKQAKDSVEVLQDELAEKLTDDEMTIVNAFIEDHISVADKINPAVKTFIKNLL